MSEQSLEAIFNSAQKGQLQGLNSLLTYGREKGFINFINRKLIWPYLLQIDTQNLSSSIFEWEGQLDRNSDDFQQLQKDAERSLSSMKTFENITKFHLQKRQRDVLKILDSFFAKNKDLKYIQGFHDVASIFLVLFGNNTGYYMMEKAGKTYFKDFLTNDIGTLSTIISEMVLELLAKKDKIYQNIFECFAEMKLIIFIVPWVLTWFAHVFSSVKIICRIWDYILCTGPQGIIYLTAGIIIATKDQLLRECADLDQASIHTFYQQKAKNESIDIESAIRFAIDLQNTVQIQQLAVYKNLDPNSIFLSNNFELNIDLHRQAKEFMKKKKEKEKAMIMKVGIATVSIFAIGVLYNMNFNKCIFKSYLYHY